MSIKTIWNKIFGIEEPSVQIDTINVFDIPPKPTKPPVARTPDQQRLFECFYGTLVDREPGGVRTHRQRHCHDGWREGKSNPFKFEGKTYDVQRNASASLDLFQELMEQLGREE